MDNYSITKHMSSIDMEQWTIIKEQGELLVQSGFFPKGTTVPGAIAQLLLGRELGVGPMTSIQQIHNIDGKLSIAPQLHLAVALRKKIISDYKVEWTKESATAWAKRSDNGFAIAYTFTIQDAKQAELTEKMNWKHYPVNLLIWRAIGYVLDIVAPEIAITGYSPEELGVENTDHNGNIPPKQIPVIAQNFVKYSNTEISKSQEKEESSSDHHPQYDKHIDTLVTLWKRTIILGVTKDEWRKVCKTVWGVESTKELTEENIKQWETLLAKHNTKESLLQALKDMVLQKTHDNEVNDHSKKEMEKKKKKEKDEIEKLKKRGGLYV